MEQWKPVKGYEGLYEVSNLGNVRSLPRNTTKGKVLIPIPTNCGYVRVNLWKEGKSKLFLIHRLVAIAFLVNPENLPCVNHKDENKRNNRLDNLEWCTNIENHNYGTINRRISNTQRNDVKKSKAVGQYARNGELVCIFPSIREAERKTGIYNQSIRNCVQGKCKTAGGYIWKLHEGEKDDGN